MTKPEKSLDFMADGGEMGQLMRAHDWANSPLGPPENWPQSLRLTIRLILNTRHPMFIWWGPDLIQFYNDAYRLTMGPERHPSALGQCGRDCWQEIWPIIGPQIEQVMSGRGSTWDEDRLVPVTRHGKLEQVWWTYSYSPIDVEGGIGGVLVVCNDVTEQHLIKDRLANRSEHLMDMFEQAPGFMAVLRGPEHVFELTNTAYRQLVGGRQCLGKPVRDIIPEVEGQGFIELLDNVYTSGKAYVGRRVPIYFQDDSETAPRQSFLDFVYQPILDANNNVTGIFVEGSDVTDHVQAEEHLRLINSELKHRVKNTLAMVSAIATQTLSGTGQDGPLDTFRHRLAIFGSAHDILTATTWATAEITDVVETALEAHPAYATRVTMAGPEITLGSKQAISLALAIHELMTNAIKYGALSNQTGKVSLNWQMSEAESNEVFTLDWREHGGPAVTKPSRRGFGSKLIERVLRADFNGQLTMDFAPTGLHCQLTTAAPNLKDRTEPKIGLQDD
ncbi:HWE histidine kinase domain-containing protein [Devosia rhodophyticola]|uniref:histidine kinase n=1 Tax=Devosia rhodophyticola TaxID=3026423 RepID=A0ABY7YV93_9HYPH|nr:PAS domain-containing sensor histidine kinase [Devosia rhodophyticola]WDR05107.1 HWE histidine kinase domain-containing protein [Devosia rhodophyticola]